MSCWGQGKGDRGVWRLALRKWSRHDGREERAPTRVPMHRTAQSASAWIPTRCFKPASPSSPPVGRYMERTIGDDVFHVGENFVDLRWEGSHLDYNQDAGGWAAPGWARGAGRRRSRAPAERGWAVRAGKRALPEQPGQVYARCIRRGVGWSAGTSPFLPPLHSLCLEFHTLNLSCLTVIMAAT